MKDTNIEKHFAEIEQDERLAKLETGAGGLELATYIHPGGHEWPDVFRTHVHHNVYINRQSRFAVENRRKPAHAHRGDGRFRATADHHFRVAPLDEAERVAEGVGAARAGGAGDLLRARRRHGLNRPAGLPS